LLARPQKDGKDGLSEEINEDAELWESFAYFGRNEEGNGETGDRGGEIGEEENRFRAVIINE
jgi:hypothetical protein